MIAAPPAFERALHLHRASIRQRHEAGRLFAEAKAAAPRGAWLCWISEAGLSRSTVCLYMRVSAALSVDQVIALGGFVAASAHLAEERARAAEDAAPEAAETGPECANARTFQAAWQAVRNRLAAHIREGEFASWIDPLRIVAVDGGGALLLARHRFHLDRVRSTPQWWERIREFWEEEVPGIPLEFAVAPDGSAGKPGPEPKPAAGRRVPILPDEFDSANPAHRMLACLTMESVEPAQARMLAALIAWRHGPKIDGWSASLDELQAVFAVDRSTIQRWTRAAQKAGVLEVVARRNRPNLYRAFPGGMPGRRQYELVLLRLLDLERQASDADAAASTAARPEVGGSAATPDMAALPGVGGGAATPGDGSGATLNQSEYDSETPADPPPAPAKRGRRAAG